MPAPWNPPKKNEDFEFTVSLADPSTPGRVKVNPTIVAGDVRISKDGGAFVNLATLPVVEPAGGRAVKVVLSASEMNADKVHIAFSDQTDPPEWADLDICILTTA